MQLIDANQDNYLEECLKIRNVLSEFEEYAVSSQSPYAQWGHQDFKKSPVAIVGAREYIFSENIGVLGDIAAGKEQTFGTLAARALRTSRFFEWYFHEHTWWDLKGSERITFE